MAYALVGTIGPSSTGTAGGAVTPAWGTGESRTAGHLLICWAFTDNSAGFIVAPSGWTRAESPQPASADLFFKIAAGGDATPTIAAISSQTNSAQLAEFSGNASTSPLDLQVQSSLGTTSPQSATLASADAAAGELVVYSFAEVYTTAATKTNTMALNNGATANDTNNNGTSAIGHFNFGFGITTGNSVADQATLTFTTTKISFTRGVVASFKLAAAAPPTPHPSPVVSQAVNRSLTY